MEPIKKVTKKRKRSPSKGKSKSSKPAKKKRKTTTKVKREKPVTAKVTTRRPRSKTRRAPVGIPWHYVSLPLFPLVIRIAFVFTLCPWNVDQSQTEKGEEADSQTAHEISSNRETIVSFQNACSFILSLSPSLCPCTLSVSVFAVNHSAKTKNKTLTMS